MKKVITFLLSSVFLVSCGSTIEGVEELASELEESRRYEYAMVLLPGGEVAEGEIDDYFTSLGGFQITFKNGETYLTSLDNIVFIKEVAE